MKITLACLLFVAIGAVVGLPVERGAFNPGSIAQASASASAQSYNKNKLAPPPPPHEQYNYHAHHSNPYGNNRKYGNLNQQYVQPQHPRSFGPGPQNRPVPQIVLPDSSPRGHDSSSKAVAIAKSADGKSIAIATSKAG